MKALLILFCILLITGVMSYGTYLIKNNYIVECFTSDIGSPYTSHIVNQPINTSFSCKNMCGPLARCSITGEQCTSDVDCFGCVPKVVSNPRNYGDNIVGENDAGKLTGGVTPTYSTLTTDIGTKAESNNLSKPPEYNQGTNLWKRAYHNGYKLFYERYRPTNKLISYPVRYTMSGEFIDDGPLASNS